MILVADCGLSAVKLSLFDQDGRLAGRASEPYPTRFDGNLAEQDPADWWQALRRAASRLEGLDAVEVVVPTGHMHGLVLVDAGRQPLLPCLTLQDRRAAGELDGLDPDAFYRTTGQVLDASLPLAKLRWLARHHPDLLGRAAALLAPKDHVRLLLCGTLATDPLDAAGTGLYDLAKGAWSEELAAACGLPLSALPPVRPSHEVAGGVDAERARELGLRPGVLVLVGAGDDVELLGAGRRPASAIEHLGTTGSILASLDAFRLDPAGRVEVYPAAIAGSYACGASTPNGGAVIAWLERALGVSADQALSSDPAGDGPVVLPHLYGERGARAAPLGRGAVVGLHPSHTSVDIARAFLVAIAFGLRDLVTLVAPLAGPIEAITTSGGGGGSAAWLRLRAAAYGRPLHVLSADPTALGCAALGLSALHDRPVADAAAALVVDDAVVEPDERLAASLEGPYLAQRALLSRVGGPDLVDHSAPSSLAHS